MTIEPERVRRALQLEAERIGEGRWIINGHLVDPAYGCECDACLHRGVRCEHELRAALDELDDELLQALGELVGAGTEP